MTAGPRRYSLLQPHTSHPDVTRLASCRYSTAPPTWKPASMHIQQAAQSLLPHSQAQLVGIFETSTARGLQQLSLKYSLPHRLVREVGAPELMWTIIR